MEKGLPENWREIIAGKKVILYNTSISNLLKGGEKHINKIEQTIDIFRHQTEAILWWRPHPLELSTVETMRPELAVKYKMIREKYIDEGWGILDTSVDVHRAIAVSDAYYGDWSSLIYLYKVTGKPILMQVDDVVKPCNMNEIALKIVDLVVEGENLWFITTNFPALFQANIMTGKIVKAILLPKEKIAQTYCVYNMVCIGNKLILIPGKGKNIITYNIDTGKMETLNIGTASERTKFGAVCHDEDVLYLFPLYNNEIWEYSISANGITRKILCDANLVVDKNLQRDGDYIYTAKRFGNAIYRYSLTEHRLDKKEFKRESERYIWIAHYGENELVISEEKKEVCLWNDKRGMISVIAELPSDYNINRKTYFLVVNIEERFYLYPCEKNDILCIDIKQEKVTKYDKISGQKSFSCVKKQGNKIYAYSDAEQCLYMIEDDGNTVCNVAINGKEDFCRELLKKNIFTYEEGQTVKEPFMGSENDFLLFNKNFVRNVCSGKWDTEKSAGKEYCGKMIHQVIMSREEKR